MSYLKNLANSQPKDPLIDIVYEITNCIKTKKDFEQASLMVKQNNLTLESVINRTSKLDLEDLALLADKVIALG